MFQFGTYCIIKTHVDHHQKRKKKHGGQYYNHGLCLFQYISFDYIVVCDFSYESVQSISLGRPSLSTNLIWFNYTGICAIVRP